MKARLRLLGAGGAALFAALACDSSSFDVDPDQFELIPRLDALDFGQVQPASAHDYWEYRFSVAGATQTPDSVIGSGGNLTKGELDPAVAAELDATRPESGFGVSCLPGYCYKYIVAARGTTVELFATLPELNEFLGAIDYPEEAIMLVEGHGYYWDPTDGNAAGVRAVDGGHELLVLELVETCAPVQVDRSLVFVSTAGAVTERDSEVWSRDDDACI